MRYTLWSRGRLVGHTDLDIHTISENMRQGFVEPTEEGKPLLRDATAVWRTMAERRRAQRARDGVELPGDLDLVMASMDRREALNLELRNEEDEVFQCDFMRVYDLFDYKAGVIDEMCETPEELEVDYQLFLSEMSPEERAEAEATRAEDDAEIEEFIAAWKEGRDEEAMFHSSWPPQPEEDPRWDTMQYHLQVFLKGSIRELEEEF
jgi:hypothetical protein